MMAKTAAYLAIAVFFFLLTGAAEGARRAFVVGINRIQISMHGGS